MLSFKNLTDPTFGLIATTHANVHDRYLSYLPISHGKSSAQSWLMQNRF